MSAKANKKTRTPERENPYAKMLTENRLKPAGQFGVDMDVSIPEGVTYDQVQEPSFWKQCSKQIGVRDKLKIFSDSNAFYAEALVIANEPGIGTQIMTLLYTDLTKRADDYDLPKAADDYAIKVKGADKWCVIRKKDNTVMSRANETELEARQALAGILSAL